MAAQIYTRWLGVDGLIMMTAIIRGGNDSRPHRDPFRFDGIVVALYAAFRSHNYNLWVT